MRTVDPELWSKKVKGRKMDLSRPFKFGQRRGGLEARLRDSFNDAMAEFCRNCSVKIVKRIVSEDTEKWDRYRWTVLLTASLFCGVLVAALDLAEFVHEPPLHVHLQTPQYPARLLPFPAIALCSYNVISRRELDRLTMLFAARDQNRTFSAAAIRRNLLTFGSLLTMSLPPLDLQFLPYISSAGVAFNVTRLMFMLAPSCESMLLKCSWRGHETPCDRLFATRLTSVGFCCVFNGRYDEDDYSTPPKVLDRVGADFGLSVILREDYDDVAFYRRPLIGTEVLIFDGSEYPLLEGGAVRVQLARSSTSTFFALSTRAQVASPNLKYYAESWRGCRVQRPGLQHRFRSYSWCLTECRRQAALQLCGCVPYTLQPRGEFTCSLNQLTCLNKHREKFLYYYPFGYTLESLSEESQDALTCEDCTADCARPVYSAAVSHAHLKHPDKMLRNKFTAGLKSFSNISVLRFFYSTEDQHLYEVEGNSNWYETFASISSQWMVLMGVSLVTLFELVFHCSFRWRHHYVRRRAARAQLATPQDIS